MEIVEKQSLFKVFGEAEGIEKAISSSRLNIRHQENQFIFMEYWDTVLLFSLELHIEPMPGVFLFTSNIAVVLEGRC